MDAQAQALVRMDAAFGRQVALIDQLGDPPEPGNPHNLQLLREILEAQKAFKTAAEEFRAAGGSL